MAINDLLIADAADREPIPMTTHALAAAHRRVRICRANGWPVPAEFTALPEMDVLVERAALDDIDARRVGIVPR